MIVTTPKKRISLLVFFLFLIGVGAYLSIVRPAGTDFLFDRFVTSDLVAFGPITPRDIKLVFDPASTTVSDLAEYAASDDFIINGPYFGSFADGSFAPAWLLALDGATQGIIDREDPNLAWMFVLDHLGTTKITPTEAFDMRDFAQVKFVFQSGPLLVSSGSVVVRDTDGWHAAKKYPRTALGIDNSGKLWFFSAPTACTLRDFAARIVADNPQIIQVLNLDGWPSTAYRTPQWKTFREHSRLPYFFIGKTSTR